MLLLAVRKGGVLSRRRIKMTMETPGEPVIARSSDERLWGMLCHLSALAILIIPYIGADGMDLARGWEA